MPNRRVLLVDDDENILAGFKRHLRKKFNMETCTSSKRALDLMTRDKNFDVIVSDMNMPELNGIQLLTEVRKTVPDCVRMMLTGNADLQTCVDAVNDGNIFRFLTKPCPPETLEAALEAGIEQHDLVKCEQELLHGTLSGAIKTLTEILSAVSPLAFSRAVRARRYVRHMVAELNAPGFWEYDMAAMLSQIGFVALPVDVIADMVEGKPLSKLQRDALSEYPVIGAKLIAGIPRMEVVSSIIANQVNVIHNISVPASAKDLIDVVEFGGQLLRIALKFDLLKLKHRNFDFSYRILQNECGENNIIVKSLASYSQSVGARIPMQMSVQELAPSMLASEDICAKSGIVLVERGTELSQAIILRLQNCAKFSPIKEPIKVEVSSDAAPKSGLHPDHAS